MRILWSMWWTSFSWRGASAAKKCSGSTVSIAMFFAVICDDQLFVKITPQGEADFPNLPKAPPYSGARDYFLVEDVDDREQLAKLVRITCEALMLQPKKRKK